MNAWDKGMPKMVFPIFMSRINFLRVLAFEIIFYEST